MAAATFQLPRPVEASVLSGLNFRVAESVLRMPDSESQVRLCFWTVSELPSPDASFGLRKPRSGERSVATEK